MKRITATILFFTALSAPALAESPTQRQMHGWDYVQQVANPAPQSEAPAAERHEQRPFYHHDGESHMDKHHGKKHHHEGKKHHHEGKKSSHHHHHHKDAKAKDAAPAVKEQPKQ